ncbi:MAG TPA: prephenate/arogenate dehydrogenase family protein [Alphaproteobacteria bacterium]|nr:prephenate/arogenate dehydrogenase family protein [Alphaproteobacteria bacterium]
MSARPLFERAALIGIGLIGSSLARRMRRDGLARTIVCNAKSERSRKLACELGIVDAAYDSPAEAVRDADLVVLCTPLGVYGTIAAAIEPHLARGAILTDVGSVKTMVMRDVGPHVPPGVHFVPSHPVAGTEHSGPESGFAELFDGRWCILTPPDDADPAAVEKVASLWRQCGMNLELMDAKHHDIVLAITSHLPHLIAYCIVGTATHLEELTNSDVIKFAAGGFRDFTRIAASDPIMWRDVFLNNREAVLEMLGHFTEDLTALQRMVRLSQGEKLEDWFTRTRAIRRSLIEAKQA